jgi:hypothetical protein
LLFKKKYFVTDGTVDKDDTFNLHLIYIQVWAYSERASERTGQDGSFDTHIIPVSFLSQNRNSIINGDLPVQRSEALSLAALQLQATIGTYNPEKHPKGFLE